MSASVTNCDCPCPDPTITEIPGVEGAAGANGTNGVNSFTTTTADFVVPALGANVVVLVEQSTFAAIGQPLFIELAGLFTVISIPSSASLELEYYDTPSNTAVGGNVVAGSSVVPTGSTFVLLAAMPNVFVNNSGGTDSDTIAAGVGTYILPIPITLAQITSDGDVLTTYTPGHAFEIIGVDARVEKVVTTVGKSVTINLEITTTDLTGGVVVLDSANCTPLGAAIAGSAVTANNVGTASQSISIEASAVTAFAEGEVILLIKIRNMDTVNAISSLATHVTGIINALV